MRQLMGINGEKIMFWNTNSIPCPSVPMGETQANKLHLHTKGMI